MPAIVPPPSGYCNWLKMNGVNSRPLDLRARNSAKRCRRQRSPKRIVIDFANDLKCADRDGILVNYAAFFYGLSRVSKSLRGTAN